MLRKWHLNIVSTFTSQFFMNMGEAEEIINTKCGPGGVLSTLDPRKFGCDIYYFRFKLPLPTMMLLG
jgi:hypothetical protein